MKKIIALMLCAVMLLALCACEKSEEAPDTDDSVLTIEEAPVDNTAKNKVVDEAQDENALLQSSDEFKATAQIIVNDSEEDTTTNTKIPTYLFLLSAPRAVQSPWSIFYSATDRKPARTDGLCEAFVEVGIQALERCAVKAVGNDACVAQDVSARVQLLGVQTKHFFLERVADSVRLCFGFACQLVIVVHRFNQAHNFILTHFGFLLLDDYLFGKRWVALSLSQHFGRFSCPFPF